MASLIALCFFLSASLNGLSCVSGDDEVCPQGYAIISSGMSKSDQENVTNVHNLVRLEIAHNAVVNQPEGNNLFRLVYNEALQEDAMFAAKTCNVEHAFPPNPHYDGEGQNIYRKQRSAKNCTPDWERAVNKWFCEHEYYDYGSGKSTNGTHVGHYTQVVWAKTTSLGCYFICFFNPENSNYPYTKLYVCNYYPGGNMQGEKPYSEEGDCPELCDS